MFPTTVRYSYNNYKLTASVRDKDHSNYVLPKYMPNLLIISI